MPTVLFIIGFVLVSLLLGQVGEVQRRDPWPWLLLWFFAPMVAIWAVKGDALKAAGEKSLRMIRGWVCGFTLVLGFVCLRNSDAVWHDLGHRFVDGFYVYKTSGIDSDDVTFAVEHMDAHTSRGKMQLKAAQWGMGILFVVVPWAVWGSYQKRIDALTQHHK